MDLDSRATSRTAVYVQCQHSDRQDSPSYISAVPAQSYPDALLLTENDPLYNLYVYYIPCLLETSICYRVIRKNINTP